MCWVIKPHEHDRYDTSTSHLSIKNIDKCVRAHSVCYTNTDIQNEHNNKIRNT